MKLNSSDRIMLKDKVLNILGFLEFSLVLDLSGARLEFIDEQGRKVKIEIGEKER